MVAFQGICRKVLKDEGINHQMDALCKGIAKRVKEAGDDDLWKVDGVPWASDSSKQ